MNNCPHNISQSMAIKTTEITIQHPELENK